MGGCSSYPSAKSAVSPRRHPNVEYSKWASTISIVADDLLLKKKREGSRAIAVYGNSTAPIINALEKSPSPGKTKIKLTSSNRQLKNDEIEFSNMSIEVLDQLKRILSKDNPDAEVVAEQLREYITNLPTSENSKECQVAHTMSKALDYNISVKENSACITWDPEGDPNACGSSNSTSGSVECGLITLPCDSIHLSGCESGESEIVLKVSDDHSDSGERIGRPRDDGMCEKMKRSHFDMIQFSKRQLIESRHKSNRMSDFLENMPSLSASLKEFNCGYAIYQDHQKDRDVESMTSKIDEFDVKIHKSTQKLTELRRRSLDIFTDGDDSGDCDQKNLKNISFVSVEKKINHWQDYKKKLVDKRNQIITKLNSKLMDQITSTPLIESSTESEYSYATVTDIERPSNF